MVSTLKIEYQVFLCIFQNNSAIATLGLKEMGTIFVKAGKKVCPIDCLSLAKLNWTNFFPYLPKKNFPISFKPKVAIQ